MYQQIYFHRTVRAIDLDLAEVFRPSILAIFGDGSPADDLSRYADLDEYALLHQAALWARGESLSDEPEPGDGTVTPEVGRVVAGDPPAPARLAAGRWTRAASYEAAERADVLQAARRELGLGGRSGPDAAAWPGSGRDGRPPGRGDGHGLAARGRGARRMPGGAASSRVLAAAAGLLARSRGGTFARSSAPGQCLGVGVGSGPQPTASAGRRTRCSSTSHRNGRTSSGSTRAIS